MSAILVTIGIIHEACRARGSPDPAAWFSGPIGLVSTTRTSRETARLDTPPGLR
ncbi:hypothetical protein ACFO0J_09995 [Castellaniella hirudinis]|uniref:Uncharacterized protein n=1 Tax=Castellaniella hirudinis TaxID=1144617 RepID=A0ABV8RYA1_9BURK